MLSREQLKLGSLRIEFGATSYANIMRFYRMEERSDQQRKKMIRVFIILFDEGDIKP